MRRLAGLAGLAGALLASFLAAATPAAAQGADDRIVIGVSNEEAMSAAEDKAREMLPYYWAAFDDPEPNETAFSLKVGFDIPDGGQEYIWVSEISRSGDRIVGVLDNYPVDVPDLRIGDAVAFTEDRIVDWGFRRDQLLVGHYTTRVLLDQMDPADAEPIRALLGEAP